MCIAIGASLPFCYRTGLGEVFFFSRTATAARIKPGASASEPQALALLSPHLVTTATSSLPPLRSCLLRGREEGLAAGCQRRILLDLRNL